MTAQRLRSAPLVLVSMAMAAAWLLQMWLDLVQRPRDQVRELPFGLLGEVWPGQVHVAFRAAIVGALTALVLAVAALGVRLIAGPSRGRIPLSAIGLVASVALLAPYLVLAGHAIGAHAPWLLLCLPTTAAGLWAVRRVERLRRVPWWLMILAAVWGGTAAYGFAYGMSAWFADYLPALIHGGTEDVTKIVRGRWLAGAYQQNFSAVLAELGKGAGVGVIYLLWRDRFTGVASGIAIGAAAGLGFNLTHTLPSLAADGGYQFWTLQVYGLLTGNALFTALTGAGFGAAAHLREPKLRRVVITAGFLAAIGTQALTVSVFRWYVSLRAGALDSSPVDYLLVQPLIQLAVQLPALALCAVLLWRGTRDARAGLGAALGAEAGTGRGAVTEPEVALLLTPVRRLWLRGTVLRRSGFAAWRALDRVLAAQYELAAAGWQVLHGDVGAPPPGEPAPRLELAPQVGPPPGTAPAPGFEGPVEAAPSHGATPEQAAEPDRPAALEALRETVMIRKAELARVTA